MQKTEPTTKKPPRHRIDNFGTTSQNPSWARELAFSLTLRTMPIYTSFRLLLADGKHSGKGTFKHQREPGLHRSVPPVLTMTKNLVEILKTPILQDKTMKMQRNRIESDRERSLCRKTATAATVAATQIDPHTGRTRKNKIPSGTQHCHRSTCRLGGRNTTSKEMATAGIERLLVPDILQKTGRT